MTARKPARATARERLLARINTALSVRCVVARTDCACSSCASDMRAIRRLLAAVLRERAEAACDAVDLCWTGGASHVVKDAIRTAVLASGSRRKGGRK